MTTSKTSKINELMTTTLDIADKQEKRALDFESKFSQSKDSDDKAAMQKAATKSVYAKLITLMSEQAANTAVTLFEQAQIVDCINDSYSVKKFTQLCEALADKDNSKLKDNKLASFAAQFALANSADSYQKYLSSCNNSVRQTQMCAKMFERLSMCKYSKAKNFLEQNTSSKAVKALHKLYA